MAQLSQNRQGGWVSAFILGLAPAVVLFVSIAVAIYLENQAELDYSLQPLAPFAILFVAWSLVWALALAVRGWSKLEGLAIALFWVGLFLFASDVVAPVQLGEIQGELETPREPISLTLMELALAVVLIGAARFCPRNLARTAGSAFVVVLLGTSAFNLVRNSAPHFGARTTAGTVSADSSPGAALRGNIYHLTFDAYSTLVFERLAQKTRVRELLDGFEYFPENRSNYMHTSMSSVSYMSGSLYQGGSLKQWRQQIHEGGLIRDYAERGYVNWTYAQSRSWVHDLASHVLTNGEVGERQDRSLRALSLADLWLVRVVPNFLQDEVFWESKGLPSRIYTEAYGSPIPASSEDARTVTSMLLTRQMIEDERKRPSHGQHVYGHIYIPHAPYVLDENCRYVSAGTGYEPQTACVTKLIGEFISELKRLGRYEDSLIVIHSDHGKWDEGLTDDEAGLVGKGSEVIDGNPREVRRAQVDNQSRSLLLIKPPGRSGEPLHVSDRLTQLLDIRPTLLQLSHGEALADAPGLNVFSETFPSRRQTPIYIGFKQRLPSGEWVVIGKGLEKTALWSLSVDEQKDWTRHPDLPASWE